MTVPTCRTTILPSEEDISHVGKDITGANQSVVCHATAERLGIYIKGGFPILISCVGAGADFHAGFMEKYKN